MWHENLTVEILQEFSAFDGKRVERLWAWIALREEGKRAQARHYAWLHRHDPKWIARRKANKHMSPKRRAYLKASNQRYRKRVRAEKRVERGIVETPCQQCGLMFIHPSYIRGGQPAKYCSVVCRRRVKTLQKRSARVRAFGERG